MYARPYRGEMRACEHDVMSARQVTVLGTASQVPTRYRNHNGYFLRFDDAGLLFDPGEGTQRQMTLAGISVSQISAICITHFHGDHCLGLPGIVQRLSLDAVDHAVDVTYPASGAVYFERLRSASIFDDRTTLRRRQLEGAEAVVAHGALTVRALPLDHRVESWGYRVEEPARRTFLPDRLAAANVSGPAVSDLARAGSLRVGGRTVRLEDVSVERRGQVFAFVMDTRLCDNAVALARGADLVVCESTFVDDEAELAAAYGHLTARQAALVAREAGATRLVLAHFSQRHPDAAVYVEEARRVHDDVIAARDGVTIAMPKLDRYA
jgi:ribonuclease Z